MAPITARPAALARPALRSLSKMATVSFPVTPPAEHAHPLGPGRFIQTAAMLVIGDEVLNGKTKDTNSNYFAKHCFELGIELKRIEVVPDEEADIVEAARRLTDRFDWVVSTGGIGPTHDDITYGSLAKAFSQPLVRHEETLRRLTAFAAEKYDLSEQTAEQKASRELMGTLPHGERTEVLFVESQKWVPVVRLAGRLCVYPGIPSLFISLLHATTPYLPLPPASSKPYRRLVKTQRPESSIAPFLTALQAEVKAEAIRIGSYPAFGIGVTVSLIGKDLGRLKELEQRVVEELDGTLVEVDDTA